MKDKIAYQNKDVASKVTGEALEGQSLAPFGLPEVKIVKALPTNLPVVESNELRLDHLFLLNDGSIGIIDYESRYSVENFIKYINYAARVIRRYAKKKKLRKLKKIKIIVIYTADVETAPKVYDLGGIAVRIETAFLVNQDTEKIYQNLKEKITNGGRISEEEIMQMMILPLTVKGTGRKQEVITRTLELAREIRDRSQKVEVLAGLLTFTDKVIAENDRQRIKEEIKMTQIGKMIFDDGLKEGTQIGFNQGISQGISRKLVDLVCRKLRKGKNEEEIAEDLEEPFETVAEICRSAAPFAPDYNMEDVYHAWKNGSSLIREQERDYDNESMTVR